MGMAILYARRRFTWNEGTEQQQTYQFTQGYNILHKLQVHHLTLFIIHNKYI